MNLFNDDCLKIMRTLPDNSVDAIVTDPPYYSTNLDFDKKQPIDFLLWLMECRRILKPSGVLVAFADFNLLAILRGHRIFNSSYEMVWQKNMAVGFLDAHIRPLRNHEFIGVFTDQLKRSTYNPQKFNYQSTRFKIGQSNTSGRLPATKHYGGTHSHDYIEDGTRYPLSVVFAQNWNGGEALKRRTMKLAGFKGHPTQKPIDLVAYLVKTYSNEDELILDPFMGSGTTGIACKNLERDFIGVELDAEYFEMAQQRIEAAAPAAPAAQNPIVAQPIQPAAKVEEDQLRLSL